MTHQWRGLRIDCQHASLHHGSMDQRERNTSCPERQQMCPLKPPALLPHRFRCHCAVVVQGVQRLQTLCGRLQMEARSHGMDFRELNAVDCIALQPNAGEEWDGPSMTGPLPQKSSTARAQNRWTEYWSDVVAYRLNTSTAAQHTPKHTAEPILDSQNADLIRCNRLLGDLRA